MITDYRILFNLNLNDFLPSHEETFGSSKLTNLFLGVGEAASRAAGSPGGTVAFAVVEFTRIWACKGVAARSSAASLGICRPSLLQVWHQSALEAVDSIVGRSAYADGR